MDPLPGKGLVRAFNAGAQGSMKDAARPWATIGGVGDMLQQVGERGIELLARHKELQIQREAANMELEFDQMQQEYELEMLQNPNMTPEQAAEGWQKRSQAWQAKYQRDGMSPMEQDHLGMRSKELAQRGQLNVLKSSMVANIQNTKQAAINLIAKGEETGNDELRQRGFSMLGQVTPEADLEAERMKSDSRVATSGVERQIASDPVRMREALKDPAAFVKANPGVSIDDVPRLQEQARAMANRSIGDSVDSFSDGVATGRIKSADDIEREFSSLPPRIREQMKGELVKRNDAEEKLRMKSPEAQAQTLGRATSIIDGIANAPDFEERYATAAFLLDSMEDSPAKRYYTDKLREAKTGREAEIKTHADAAMKALEVFDKRELERKGYGSGAAIKIPGAQEIPTARAIADGFLNDWNKLKALGFSDEQASQIKDAKDASNKPSDAASRKVFRELWKDREGGSFGADPFTIATADAILGGKDTVSYIAQEDEDEAFFGRLKEERAAGERKLKLAEWLKLNPDAKPAEIENHILEITNEQTQRELKSLIRGVDDGSTSFNDIPTKAPRGDFPTDASGIVTAQAQITVQANAKPYLKNPGFDLTNAPLGMRNNNPTNIVYPNEATARRFGAIGKSSNHDAGSTDGKGGSYRQMVFANPEDGMKAGARLALSKYRSGKVTTNSLIASSNGWTPGNYEAARNIAKTMGIGPNDDIRINTPSGMVKFLKALTIQEHGNAARQYKDSLFAKAAASTLHT